MFAQNAFEVLAVSSYCVLFCNVVSELMFSLEVSTLCSDCKHS